MPSQDHLSNIPTPAVAFSDRSTTRTRDHEDETRDGATSNDARRTEAAPDDAVEADGGHTSKEYQQSDLVRDAEEPERAEFAEENAASTDESTSDDGATVPDHEPGDEPDGGPTGDPDDDAPTPEAATYQSSESAATDADEVDAGNPTLMGRSPADTDAPDTSAGLGSASVPRQSEGDSVDHFRSDAVRTGEDVPPTSPYVSTTQSGVETIPDVQAIVEEPALGEHVEDRATQPAAVTEPVGADEEVTVNEDTDTGGVGERAPGDVVLEPVADLWPSDAAEALRERWRELQLRFVDDPHNAAAEADFLVGEAIETLTGALANTRTELSQWRSDGGGDTERLRVAVQRYRDFLDRVLGL